MEDAKDWVMAAANEILDAKAREGFDGRYRNAALTEIRLYIEKHSPFRSDVAYMPVPRCDGCRHWTRGVIPVIKKPSCGGTCANPELRAIVGEQQTMETAEDFGCVQWEAK